MAYCLVYFGYYNPRWGLQHTSGSIGKDSKHILRVPPCFTSLGLYSFQWMQKYNDRSLLSHGKRDARRPTRERKQSIPRSARRHPLSGDLMWRNPGPEYLKSNDSHGNQRKRQTSRNTETVDHSWEVINTGYSEEEQSAGLEVIFRRAMIWPTATTGRPGWWRQWFDYFLWYYSRYWLIGDMSKTNVDLLFAWTQPSEVSFTFLMYTLQNQKEMDYNIL